MGVMKQHIVDSSESGLMPALSWPLVALVRSAYWLILCAVRLRGPSSEVLLGRSETSPQ
jgi:hypothetical protein